MPGKEIPVNPNGFVIFPVLFINCGQGHPGQLIVRISFQGLFELFSGLLFPALFQVQSAQGRDKYRGVLGFFRPGFKLINGLVHLVGPGQYLSHAEMAQGLPFFVFPDLPVLGHGLIIPVLGQIKIPESGNGPDIVRIQAHNLLQVFLGCPGIFF